MKYSPVDTLAKDLFDLKVDSNSGKFTYELTDQGKEFLRNLRDASFREYKMSNNAEVAERFNLLHAKSDTKLDDGKYLKAKLVEDAVALLTAVVANDGTILTPDRKVETLTYKDIFDSVANIINDSIETKYGLDKKELKATDYLTTNDVPFMLGEVLREVAVNTIEPNYFITSMFKRLNIPPNVTILERVFVNVSGKADRANTRQEAPTVSVSWDAKAYRGGSRIHIKVAIDRDIALAPNSFGIIKAMNNEAVNALLRFRETEAFAMMYNNGTVTFDNGSGDYSNTSGRDASGAVNGTFSVDDLITMCTDLVTDNFTPDVIFMHPLAWLTWVHDPVLKQYAFMRGDVTQYARPPMGKSDDPAAFSPTGAILGSPFTGAVKSSLHINVPAAVPYPLQVIVTPFVPINTSNQTTTIMVCDSRYLGVYAEREGVSSVGWKDIEHDVQHIKYWMEYALFVPARGKGIRLAKTIKYNERSYYFGPEIMRINVTSDAWQDAPGSTPI